MESKNLMEVTEYSLSYYGGYKSAANEAAIRIQNRIKTGTTLVSVHVANPRCKVS